MGLNMNKLENCFNRAVENNAKWVAVLVQAKGSTGNEIILNPRENFNGKLEYYKGAYTDDLVLKAYDGIKIVGFTFGFKLSDIETDLGL